MRKKTDQRVTLYSLYANICSSKLRELYSRKFVRLQKLQSQHMGLLAKREANSLEAQMRVIEAELAARDAQLALF